MSEKEDQNAEEEFKDGPMILGSAEDLENLPDANIDLGDGDQFSDNFRCGFVAILGKPNAGKSTLANALIGEKLIAVSGLPQTTRDKINAIYNDDQRQIIFVDLPGLVEDTDKLNAALRDNVIEGLEGVDLVLHLIDVNDEIAVDEDMASILQAIKTPIIAAITKIDSAPKNFSLEQWQNEQQSFTPSLYQKVLQISATKNLGLDELLESISQQLPKGFPLYDPEDITDRDLRFLSAELIREKIFLHMHQELPYACAVQIDRFEERNRGKWFISATIFVERDNQKGMIIGKGGSNLKRISLEARKDLENLCGNGIYLELFVKTAKNWRRNDFHLNEFGYKTSKRKK